MTYYSHKEEKGMENFVINSVLWTLALYGLFELIKQIIYMCTYTNLKEDGIYIIIAVKNQEERIEGAYNHATGTRTNTYSSHHTPTQ